MSLNTKFTRLKMALGGAAPKFEAQPNEDHLYEIEAESDEEAILIARLDGSNKSARENQRMNRRRWRLIDNFLLGNQSLTGPGGEDATPMIDGSDNDLLDENEVGDINEEYVTNNKILEVHREDMARFTRYNANIGVQPNNPNSESDKRASRIAKTVLQDILAKNKFDRRIKIRGARIITSKGSVFLKVTFDPTKGKIVRWPIYDPATDDVKVDAKGEPMFEEGPEGEVVWTIVSPRNLVFPRGCVDIETAPWIQESNIRSTAWVRDHYGMDLPGENLSEEETYYYPLAEDEEYAEGQDDDNARVLLKERFYRPCAEFPRGAIFVWANKRILRASTLLDFYPDMMYFQANNIYNENYIFGDTPYWHILSDQIYLNKVDSAIMRYSEIWGNIKMFLPEGCNLEEDDITNEADQVHKMGGKEFPQYAKPPDLPQTVQTFRAQLLENIRSKSAIRDRTRAAASGNVIAYEQDQDDSTISPALAEIEQMLEDGCQFSLRLVAENYLVPRIVGATGGTKRGVVEDFVGKMLEGNFNAKVSLMNGLPANKYAKQQYLMGMFKVGALTQEQLLKYSEFPDIEKIFEDANKDNEIVEDFIERLQRGEPLPIMPWHNLELLSRKLKLFLGENYFQLEPEVQVMAQQLYQDIEARLMAQAQQQAMMASAVAAPGGGQAAPAEEQPLGEPDELGGATSPQVDGGQPGADARPDLGPGAFQQV